MSTADDSWQTLNKNTFFGDQSVDWGLMNLIGLLETKANKR